MDYNKDIINHDLRKELWKFPLYKDEDLILVYLNRNIVYIKYASLNHTNKYFDLEIKGDTCDVRSTYIENEKRDSYKDLLADIIENFCFEKLNCKTFVTTPTILTKRNGFWQRRGFHFMNALVLEKNLDGN